MQTTKNIRMLIIKYYKRISIHTAKYERQKEDECTLKMIDTIKVKALWTSTPLHKTRLFHHQTRKAMKKPRIQTLSLY
jgi:hypothetical protein